MKTKSEIRFKMIRQIKSLTEKEKSLIETELFNKVIQSAAWNHSFVIGLTMSLPQEWDTHALIQYGINNNKKIVLPKSDAENKTMIFYEVKSFDQLKTGYGGILEPDGEICNPVKVEEIDLVIVPGFAYDQHGYRVGFGGGFYDRFLEKYTGQTLSMAAEFQMISQIPINQYDKKVKTIVTEKNTYNL